MRYGFKITKINQTTIKYSLQIHIYINIQEEHTYIIQKEVS